MGVIFFVAAMVLTGSGAKVSAAVAQPASDRVTRYASIGNGRVILLILVPWLAPSKRAFSPQPARFSPWCIAGYQGAGQNGNDLARMGLGHPSGKKLDHDFLKAFAELQADILRFGSLSVRVAMPDSDTTADGARLTEKSPSERIDRLAEWAHELWRKAYE